MYFLALCFVVSGNSVAFLYSFLIGLFVYLFDCFWLFDLLSCLCSCVVWFCLLLVVVFALVCMFVSIYCSDWF